MSQFTNWLIETHPEYIKGSRILEQVQGPQGPITNPICPISFFDKVRKLSRATKIKYYGFNYPITDDMVAEAHAIDKNYYPVSIEDFELTKIERENWIKGSGGKETNKDIDDMLVYAKKYMGRSTAGAIRGSLPGFRQESANMENAIKRLMEWKDWEWKDVSFPPVAETLPYGTPIPKEFEQSPLRTNVIATNSNLLVINKKIFEDRKYSDMKPPKYGSPPVDPTEPAKPTDPSIPSPPTPDDPGGDAPGGSGGSGGSGGGPSLEKEDADDAAFKVARKKALDNLTQQMAQVEARKQAEIVRKQKEKAAAVSATKPPGAGGGVPPGAGGGVPPGATGGGAADDIFLKPPEKVSPNLQKYDQYHLRNRPKISNAMAGVVEHLSKHGLEVYVNGRSLTIMDDTQETPVPIHKGLLDNAEHDSAIYKELWKASLNPKVNTQLGGEDLQQVLRRFGFNKMDFSDYNVQTPDQLKSRSSYGAAPIPKYNADELNKGNQFWRIK